MASLEDLLPNCSNISFIEELYRLYVEDPTKLSPQWQDFFKAEEQNENAARTPAYTNKRLFRAGSAATSSQEADDASLLQDKVARILRAYRVRGHLKAQLDPLGLARPEQKELDPAFYGIRPQDLSRPVRSAALHTQRTLLVGELLESLEKTYCSAIGIQYMHIDDYGMKQWLEFQMEVTDPELKLSAKQQLHILRKLVDAVSIEEFIRVNYPGAKSFSLEGAESLIPLLSQAIEMAADQGVQEIVIAMAHRGRLSVLANIMDKDPGHIFREFDDANPERFIGRGDVKYHLGYSSDWFTQQGNETHLTLCFNPSHLEYVNTVALGRTRAKQDRIGDSERKKKLTILIHGDAAFAGEGIVQETLNLSEVDAYRTGGTLHLVVNNQIGFTTPPEQSRSTTYATDIAKMLQIPIFHVNGENPEAVAKVVQVGMDFRHKFSKDVVIDMYGYRKWGHNEGDEPAFTQPLMYKAIRARKNVLEGYLEHMLALGQVSQQEALRLIHARQAELQKHFERVRQPDYDLASQSAMQGLWRGYQGGPEKNADDPVTGVNKDQIQKLASHLTAFPEGFSPHKKIERLFNQRRQMGEGKRPIDWGMAELLALGSLAQEGARVRMTGQDAQRGTFSHRHSVIHDQKTGDYYMALANLHDAMPVEIYNSPLSEAGVLGFEYGYSLDTPDGLTVWEAQFGDFANCAQVIMDQFISSAEDKWNRLSALVLLLPHGFEGQGPEHSSARIERYLDLCAEDNMQVIVPTTPAQIFHAFRRQVVRRWRKPLIVFSPKSLLRLKDAVSSLEELSSGTFQRVIADASISPKHPPERVLLCSGKVFYELCRERDKQGRHDVPIIRLEQLYPFPENDMQRTLEAYSDNTPVCWVQDEPENMGAWRYLRERCGTRLLDRFHFFALCRPASASPATGSKSAHTLEQNWLVDKAFTMPLVDAGKRQTQNEVEIKDAR
jgi:2-oxoglutarate dehydrogenase E1 component